jgi:hypothetical protein
MLREPHVPILLWIATAVLVHMGTFGGAERVADWVDDGRQMYRFAARVLQGARAPDETIEVSFDVPPPVPASPPADEAEGDPCAVPGACPDAPPDPLEAAPKPKPESKPEPTAKPTQNPLPAPPPPEPPKAEPPAAVEPPALPPPPADPAKRIAVQQHVDDPNQPDNPDAEFIADEANRVKEQTQARVTAHDRNDREPTPGASHTGPDPDVGNADETRIGHGEDAPDRPGVSKPPPAPERLALRAPEPPPRAPGSPRSDSGRAEPQQPTAPPQEEQSGRAPGEPSPGSPDLATAEGGSFNVPGGREAQPGAAPRPARKKRLPPPRPSGRTDWLGFGAAGTTPGGVNLNLTPQTATAAIGADQLAFERRRDGERLRSKHRGSFRARGIERWRASIENYVPSVKPGNQTALNTARVPFASYLNQIHNRIHPIFADGFLSSLDRLPATHALNREEMSTHLEIVVNQDDGRLVRMGITKTSGVTAFDIGALESVDQSAPFGKPPSAIVSPDGNVYLHWEFHRNPQLACSTYFARPYILKVPPAAPTAPPGEQKDGPPPRDAAPRDERHGKSEDGGAAPRPGQGRGARVEKTTSG